MYISKRPGMDNTVLPVGPKLHHACLFCLELQHGKFFWGVSTVSSPDPSPVGKGTPAPYYPPSLRFRCFDRRTYGARLNSRLWRLETSRLHSPASHTF